MKGKDNFNGALYNDLYARALRRQTYIHIKIHRDRPQLSCSCKFGRTMVLFVMYNMKPLPVILCKTAELTKVRHEAKTN